MSFRYVDFIASFEQKSDKKPLESVVHRCSCSLSANADFSSVLAFSRDCDKVIKWWKGKQEKDRISLVLSIHFGEKVGEKMSYSSSDFMAVSLSEDEKSIAFQLVCGQSPQEFISIPVKNAASVISELCK